MTRKEFRIMLVKVNDEHVEKLRSFVKNIPAVGNLGRKKARELFYRFTNLKVSKGWKLHSYDELSQRKDHSLLHEPRKIYIIVSGSFIL